MKNLPVLFLLCLPFALCSQSFKVIGYFPTYRFSWINDIEYERLTHVNIAFGNPDAAGNISCSGAAIGPAIDMAHQHGCQVFISLAGGYLTADQEAAWDNLTLPANRPGFIQKIVQYVQDQHLDGVDLDLEWQYVKDWYSPFVLELKTALAAQGIPLTAALPGSYRYPKITNAALNAFDWINMMIYDLRGPWDESNPGQHSPYNWAVQCVQYWKNQQQVPGSRLTLGVPFYGYDFGVSPVSSFTYRGIVNQDPANAYRDEIGQKYWNGIPTIQQKTELALDEVSGIMIWEIGQDAFGANIGFSLLRAIDEKVDAAAVSVNEQSIATLRIFPNPVRERLQLELPDGVQGRLTITDARGNRVDDRLDSDKSVEVAHLPAGVYFVAWQTGSAVYTGKFIKV